MNRPRSPEKSAYSMCSALSSWEAKLGEYGAEAETRHTWDTAKNGRIKLRIHERGVRRPPKFAAERRASVRTIPGCMCVNAIEGFCVAKC